MGISARRAAFGLAALIVMIMVGGVRAQDQTEELRKVLEAQSKEIQQLKERLDAAEQHKVNHTEANSATPATVTIGEAEVRKVVADYLAENPGAGMPASVQTGWFTNSGFTIRSTKDPSYVAWQDESRIPFELRIRGRVQFDYYFYQPTDKRNHQTGARLDPPAATTGAAAGIFPTPPGTFSQEMIKRGRLIFQGNVFSPDLRYNFDLDGNTRGLAATVPYPANPGTNLPNFANGGVTAGNSVALVDHAFRLYSAFIAYDWHPCCSSRGCGENCPEGTVKYGPTVTFIVGKYKPFFSFEEYLGSANEQFVEWGMAEMFFDADDDNFLTQAGVQIKAAEDRLYVTAAVSNGNESQTPNLTMDDFPGVLAGFWYDFGGNWNPARKAWDLYGDCISDIDYSVCPVLRVGGMTNIVPMDRRSIYGNTEQARVRVIQPGPGGTSFMNQFNNVSPAGAPFANAAAFNLDRFDEYTFEAFAAGKFRGFSLLCDSWFRVLDDFRAPPGVNGAPIAGSKGGINPTNAILYQPGNGITGTSAAVFNKSVIYDYGFMLQGGYFIIPRKLEVCARWSWLRGESGDVFGDGVNTAKPVVVPGAATQGITKTVVLANAFSNYHEADEFAVGLNYFFKRQLCKWQTDFSVYQGGNPAAGGQGLAGFIPGVDGWQVRTQIQVGF